MVKKIATVAAAGAMLAAMAVPVLAYYPMYMGGDSNTAYVTNYASAVSSTGGNWQWNTGMAMGDDGDVYGGNSMTTGNAHSYAEAVAVANVDVGCCDEGQMFCRRGCHGGGYDNDSESNFAMVTNGAEAGAGTGVNEQWNTGTAFGDQGGMDGGMCGYHRGRCGGDDGDGASVVGVNNMTTGSTWSDSYAWTLTNVSWDR